MAYDNEKITSIMEQVFQIMPQLLDERQRRLLYQTPIRFADYALVFL